MDKSGYINIQGWMRTELGLTGTPLMVYAIVYGFSQDGESAYTGGHQYIMDWLGCSRNTARKILRELVDAGLVERKDEGKNGVIVSTFSATPTKFGGVPLQNLEGAPTKIGGVTPPKIGGININSINKKENKDIYSRFDFLKALKSLGVSDQLAADWMRVRKNKRLTNTKTAFDNIAAEIAKTGRPAEDCVKLAVERSWGGFKSEWMPRQQEGVWQGSIDDYLKSQGYALND